MAELALLAGLGYAGYISKNEEKNVNKKTLYDDKILLDDYRYSDFNSNIANKVDENIKNVYNQRKKDTMDPKKFMIPVYYGLEDKLNEMGPGTDIIKDKSEDNFSKQFELQKFNTNKAVPFNDEIGILKQTEKPGKNKWSVFEDFTSNNDNNNDMTYGIVAKEDKSFVHNNMNIFNRMRDFETPQLRDNRKLEYFSGSSKTYTPKKEIEHFFKPVTGVTWGQGGMQPITSFIESRMYDGVRLEKRKQKPFEPRKIGPGIGLSVDKDSLGGIHDTIRVLPQTVDELRRRDNPKLSYTPPVLPGKKGEGRSIVAAFEHRRPNKFRKDVEQVKSGGQCKAPRTSDNINIDLGNRTFSTPIIGSVAGNYGISTPKMKGEVKNPKDKQLREINQGPIKSNNKSLQDQKSYKSTNTQRMYTNQEINGNIRKTQAVSMFNPNNYANPTQQLDSYGLVTGAHNNQGSFLYDPNDSANATQQLQSFEPVGASNQNQGLYSYNPNSVANETQQLQRFEPVGASNQNQGPYSYNPNSVANETQQLQRFEPVGASNQNQGPFLYDPNNIPNTTQQLQSFVPVGASNKNQGPFLYDPNNIPNTTQQLQSFEPVGASNKNQGPFLYDPNNIPNTTQQLQSFVPVGASNKTQGPFSYNPNDLPNSKQQLQRFEPIGPNYEKGIISYNPNDLINSKQLLPDYHRTNIDLQYKKMVAINPNDIAKSTQELSAFNAVGPNYEIKAPTSFNPNDLARETQQLQNFNLGSASNQVQGPNMYNPFNIPKQTGKETIMTQSFNTFIGTHQDSGYAVTDATAPTTLKQLVNYNNHIQGVGNESMMKANSNDATNWDARLTLKDIVKSENYVGSGGNSFKTINNIQYNNAQTNAIKEIIITERNPTSSNVSMIPNINTIGNIALKDHVNIDRFNPPRQTDFNSSRTVINQINKTNPYFQDNINQNQIDTLSTNPYYSNGINQMYHYVNNPIYANSINHEKLVIAPLNQSICLNQGHLQ